MGTVLEETIKKHEKKMKTTAIFLGMVCWGVFSAVVKLHPRAVVGTQRILKECEVEVEWILLKDQVVCLGNYTCFCCHVQKLLSW